MAQPRGFKDSQHPDYVCKLHKAIYGLRQALRAWHDALKSFITSYGFTTRRSNPSLFIYISGNITVYFLVYVDDLLLTGNNTTFIDTFIEFLSNRLSLKNMGAPYYFMGIELIPMNSSMFLSQHKYIKDVLEKFEMQDVKSSPTPLASTTTLMLHDGTPTNNATQYQRIIGALQYLTLTRPGLSFSINKLSIFMHKPTSLHLPHLRRLLEYLKSTINFAIVIRKPHSFNMIAYTDANWGEIVDDNTLTLAYIIFFGGNPISWLSKKQRTMDKSSSKAKYWVVATTTVDIIWLTNLLSKLCVTARTQPTLLCDSVGDTYLCSNPILHSRMKHIALDYHFVRDHVQVGKLHVLHVSTKYQLADILTKPLATSRFRELTTKIQVTDDNLILMGHIR